MHISVDSGDRGIMHCENFNCIEQAETFDFFQGYTCFCISQNISLQAQDSICCILVCMYVYSKQKKKRDCKNFVKDDRVSLKKFRLCHGRGNLIKFAQKVCDNRLFTSRIKLGVFDDRDIGARFGGDWKVEGKGRRGGGVRFDFLNIEFQAFRPFSGSRVSDILGEIAIK